MRSNCTTVVSAVPVSNPERYVANVHVRDHELSQPTHPSNYTSNRAEPNISPTTSKQKDTVFVVGDSMTKVLSPVKLSDSRVKVTVKSHPGGRVSTLKNTLCNGYYSSIVESAKAIVLHVVTNDIADADTAQDISKQIKDTISSVRNINPSVKFVISSIIPRKNDKLINSVICQANKALKKVCSEKGHHFQDNDSDFLVKNQPIPSMYWDPA